MHKNLVAGVLDVAYLEYGPVDGTPVILLHGFPYDVQSYTEVAPAVADRGHRVIVPWLRGYGPTRFLSPRTPRSGEQAVLGQDLLALLDALDIERAVLGGYDWGGRAACVVSALWPNRVIGLATVNGYNLQHIASAMRPQSPRDEHRFWYQYYFHSERGRAGLTQNRYGLCKLLWELWSPNWAFDDQTYAASAPSFDNPDFVDVVIHSYRHRYGLAKSDPDAIAVEAQLARRPRIEVPTIALDGGGDGVRPPGVAEASRKFFGQDYDARLIPSVGHNLPQEAPQSFSDAIIELVGTA